MMRIRIIGDNILREPTKKVTQFDEELVELIDNMIDTMHEADGIGLAAPQVGLSMRLLVADVSEIEKEGEPRVFINPNIRGGSGEVAMEEGCLSIPGIREEVTRPEEIILEYQIETGEKKTETFNGWMARVLQHEIDHLEGVLFVDHLSPIKKKLISNQLSAISA